MDTLRHSAWLVIACPAGPLYEMVSDVTRMGEWSPVCKACWWDEGDGPRVGAWFTGRNERPGQTWETRCEVIAAEPGREFAFVVRGSVRWGYSFDPVGASTRVTESWEILPEGIAAFKEKYGDDAVTQMAARQADARENIAASLHAMKQGVEGAGQAREQR
jgi:Polyketide cyclase / dehydrase and lipid transport